MAGGHWSRAEVEAAVQDYLDMLALERSGKPYTKKEHNLVLRQRLQGRSHGSVEFKHQNISAVLAGMGLPYIDGYKPRGNVQALLREVVGERVSPLIDELTREVSAPQEAVTVPDVLSIRVEPPKSRLTAAEEPAEYVVSRRSPKPFDYVQQEAANKSLGDAGETLIMVYEQARLQRAGKDHLARNVEHVAKTVGDHLGYDIHSYEETGRDRFVEVKTTRYGKRTPFYISAGEIRFSKANSDAYQLYRVFEFRERPKLFTLPGDVERNVTLRATNYRAYL